MSGLIRWQGFLDQIVARYTGLCDEGAAKARQAYTETGDITRIGVTWMPYNERLSELENKIIDTWDEKVSDALDAEGIPHERAMTAREQGARLAFDLENRRHQTDMRMIAWGAREELARASSAPDPENAKRNAMFFGSHAFGWEAAEVQWLEMREVERRLNNMRPPRPLAIYKEYELAQIRYWFPYCETRARIDPTLADVKREVRAKMEFWYMHAAELEAVWRDAGRPRAAI